MGEKELAIHQRIITNELGLNTRNSLLLNALDNGEITLNRGAFVAVGHVSRSLELLKELQKRGVISEAVFVDVDPGVVTSNQSILPSDLGLPVSVVNARIEGLSLQQPASIVDWSNSFMWRSFEPGDIGPNLQKAALNLVSDFIYGKVAHLIASKEPTVQLRRLPTAYIDDYEAEPRGGNSVKAVRTLHAMATTIHINQIVDAYRNQ